MILDAAPKLTSKPRIGVIGAGHLGRIHAKLLAASPLCAFQGVADPSQDARDQVTSQLNAPAIADYCEWEGLIDGVVIAAPTFLHNQIGVWCLSRGIHVLMEKPIASSLAEAKQLIQIASANGCTLQVGHVERFNPAWQLACSQLDQENVCHIDAVREGVYTGRSTDIGVVLDLMIHDIDLILSFVQSPVDSVSAFGWNVLGEHEDFATACLHFRNGKVANLRASRISAMPKRAMQFYGNDGLFEIDFSTSTVSQTSALDDVADRTRQADRLPFEQRANLKDKLFVDWLQKTECKAAPINAIEQEHVEFISAIEFGTEVTVTGDQGHSALEVASRILDHIADNRPARSIIPAAGRFGNTRAA